PCRRNHPRAAAARQLRAADGDGGARDGLHGGCCGGAPRPGGIHRHGARRGSSGDDAMILLRYPLLWFGLFGGWLILNGSAAPGHLLLGAAVATIGAWAVQALEPPRSRLKRPAVILTLIWIVLSDIVRSNLAVLGLLI